MVGRTHAPTGANDLVLSRPILEGEVRSLGSEPLSLQECTRNERELIGLGVLVSYFSRYGSGLSLRTPLRRCDSDIITFLCVLEVPSWSDIIVLSCQSLSQVRGVVIALEGFLGILIILHEMSRGWRFRFGFLGGVFQADRRRYFS